MVRDPRAYLWDIQQAAASIRKFIANLDPQTYAESEIIHSAVERKFEIIGEALAQLSKSEPALAYRIPYVRDIIAFRNVLIHGYATVDHDRVWRTAEISLPDLQTVVATLLEEFGKP